MLQRIDLGDRVAIAPAAALAVDGFARGHDRALGARDGSRRRAGVEPRWRATITKRTPGRGRARRRQLGRGDRAPARERVARAPAPGRRAARAGRVARRRRPVLPRRRARSSARGDGSELTPLDLPQDYWVRAAPAARRARRSRRPPSTERFDERNGAAGSGERLRRPRHGARPRAQRPRDLAALPPNDLASSPHAAELLGARRLPGGRHRSRPGRLRPLPAPPHRGSRRAARARAPTAAPGSPFRSGTGERARYRCHVSQLPTIEHRQGRFAPVLRQRRSHVDPLDHRRSRGILVVLDVIPWWSVLARRRRASSPTSRSGGITAARAVREVALDRRRLAARRRARPGPGASS